VQVLYPLLMIILLLYRFASAGSLQGDRRCNLRNLRLLFSTLPLLTLCTAFCGLSHARRLFAGAEVAGEVMQVYKEAGASAWHTLASWLHSACSHCASNLVVASPTLKFLWKEFCVDCQHPLRAATGDFSAVVMGCEMVVLLLVAFVACGYSSHSAGTVCYLVD